VKKERRRGVVTSLTTGRKQNSVKHAFRLEGGGQRHKAGRRPTLRRGEKTHLPANWLDSEKGGGSNPETQNTNAGESEQ